MIAREVGERVRRLRHVSGLGQVEFADRIGIASGSVSKLENGRLTPDADLVRAIAEVLDCSPSYLAADRSSGLATRPWLRAYADAPKRVVDRQLADCVTAVEVIEDLGLKSIPDTVPEFDKDPSDDEAVELFAGDVRAAAGIGEGDIVGNSIRAAERLGCLVLPMRAELGRHVGLSSRVDLRPVICVSRPSLDPSRDVPGDRQRFTVAHELGHIALHGSIGPPNSAEEARRIEREAHLFAGAFLAPGDAILESLYEFGGRVTLKTLARIKERWGIAIKALVIRFRSLGVIDEYQARSLYKQISARGWNKGEPVSVGNEEAVWLSKAIGIKMHGAHDSVSRAADAVGLGVSHVQRWIDWSPTASEVDLADASVIDIDSRSSSRRRGDGGSTGGGSLRVLPVRGR